MGLRVLYADAGVGLLQVALRERPPRVCRGVLTCEHPFAADDRMRITPPCPRRRCTATGPPTRCTRTCGGANAGV